MFTDEFLRAIPKTDLHVHLDGSLRLETVIELAKEQNVDLPYETVEEMQKNVFKERFTSLEDYLACFKYTVAVMQTPAALRRIAYEFAVDNYSEGVRYFEVRFAPQLHASAQDSKMSVEQVLINVNEGLRRATDEFNARRMKRKSGTGIETFGPGPAYRYGIIVSALRMFTRSFSDYYRVFYECHKHEKSERIYALASASLVAAAIEVKEKEHIPIVALDIAGAENGFPARDHKEAYEHAQKHFLNTTCHAGEGFGPESIYQALTDLNTDRIGHGFHIYSLNRMESYSGDLSKERFINNLVEYVARRRITLEVCLTSNLGTMPDLAIADHPFGKMITDRLSVTLCTDNRLVSSTTTVKELKLACDTFQLTAKQLRDIVICGFKRSFNNLPYAEKRTYVRETMDYYDKIAKHYMIEACPSPVPTTLRMSPFLQRHLSASEAV